MTSSVVSTDSNVTVSTLSITPTIQDNGSHLACQAKVKGLVGSAKDDSRKIIVNCEYYALIFIILDTGLGKLSKSLGSTV